MRDIARGSTIRVLSTRYGGAQRDLYEAQFVDHMGSVVRGYVPAGSPMYGLDNCLLEPAEVSAIEIYFTDRSYNIIHRAERKTCNNYWYINVAKPAKFDGTTLSWVDLGIDVSSPVDGPLVVHNEDELELNTDQKSYLRDLVDRVLQPRDEILRLGRLGKFPFDRERQIEKLRELERL